jgi:hypothetical protein
MAVVKKKNKRKSPLFSPLLQPHLPQKKIRFKTKPQKTWKVLNCLAMVDCDTRNKWRDDWRMLRTWIKKRVQGRTTRKKKIRWWMSSSE